MIEGVGFQDVKIKKLTLGIAVLFMAKKSF